MARVNDRADSEWSRGDIALASSGLTLLGVLLGIGMTVAIGIDAGWWVRVVAGLGTSIFLMAGVKLGTQLGRRPLARLAAWVIGHDAPDQR